MKEDLSNLNCIYLDIETIPSEKEEFVFDKNNYTVPKTYASSEEKRTKWLDEQMEKKFEKHDEKFLKQSLDKLKAKVICVSIIYPVSDTESAHDVVVSDDEESLFKNIDTICSSIPRRGYRTVVTFNGNNFDLPILALRALKYKCGYLYDVVKMGKFDQRSLDLMTSFNFSDYRGMVSLDSLCKFFGLNGKYDGMSGADVYPAYLNGERDKIGEYCADDTYKLVQLHRILNQDLNKDTAI